MQNHKISLFVLMRNRGQEVQKKIILHIALQKEINEHSLDVLHLCFASLIRN